MQPKTTAKDFFFYLTSFVTLYVSAVSLIALLFTIINKAFPDALNSYYYYGGDLYSSGMRAAIACLVIVFPLYLVVASYLNRYLRANPDKKELGVRKWLTYLTLFVTGAAAVTDLIVLVNTFLGGEITIRFVLKVLVVLLVSGAVFAYYLYDLKKAFTPDMPNRSKLIISLACVLVFGSLIGGLTYAGSPMKVRSMKFDETRVSDLSNIQWQIINYWQRKGAIPATLAEVQDPISGNTLPKDPEGREYTYAKTGAMSFKLCANFSLSNEKTDIKETYRSYPAPTANENWKHGAGNTCFDRTIDPQLYPVYDNNGNSKPVIQNL